MQPTYTAIATAPLTFSDYLIAFVFIVALFVFFGAMCYANRLASVASLRSYEQDRKSAKD